MRRIRTLDRDNVTKYQTFLYLCCKEMFQLEESRQGLEGSRSISLGAPE